MLEMLTGKKMSKAAQIRELEGKIVTVCVQCPHAHFAGGTYRCDRKRSQCHSKRVLRWLDEIKKLGGESEDDRQSSTKSG